MSYGLVRLTGTESAWDTEARIGKAARLANDGTKDVSPVAGYCLSARGVGCRQ